LLLICQIFLTAGLFWFGVWVMVSFYSPSAELTWRRYSIYCVLLVLGLTLEYLGRDNSREYLLQNELLRQHRLSLRQTFASLGSPERARQMRNWLQRKSEIGLHTAGLICANGAKAGEADVPVLGGPPDFERIVRERGVTQVILLEFPHTDSSRAIIGACDELGIRLVILSDLEETLRHPVVHFEDGGFRFIALREEPLENPLNRFMKRTIDIIA